MVTFERILYRYIRSGISELSHKHGDRVRQGRWTPSHQRLRRKRSFGRLWHSPQLLFDASQLSLQILNLSVFDSNDFSVVKEVLIKFCLY